MATSKKPDLVFEMNGEQFTVKQIEEQVKAVKGTKTAYVNCAEAAIYCVDGNGNTTKVSLVSK